MSVEEVKVPVVQVNLLAGRSKEQKAKIAKAFTDSLVEHGNVPREIVVVIFNEVARDDWAAGCTLVSDKQN